MAKIIYKEGCEGQDRLECIRGIEIDMLNGQKCLVYPKYAKCKLLNSEVGVSEWDAPELSEIEALKVEDTTAATNELLSLGSPAAKHVREFGDYNLPSLLAAMEICGQRKDIDALARQIEGADRLCDNTPCIWSSCCYFAGYAWLYGSFDFAAYFSFYYASLAVPVTLLKVKAA